jgi:glycosyltransferase involved in cell wall biosynthesis
LRILIVTQYFWPENFRINDLAQGLRDRGHAVAVLTGKPNYPAGRFFPGYGFFGRTREKFNGIEVRRVPLIPRGGGSGARLLLNYLSFAVTASLLAPFRMRGGFDAILVYEPSPVTVGIPALALKALKGAPVFFWVQDLWPESLSITKAISAGWLLKLTEIVVRFIYHGCDRILVQSRAYVEPVRRLGVSADRILYYPNSAEAVYHPVEVEADAHERALLPRGFRVMFAGNIGVSQDFETILAAAELLHDAPDVHWVVLGDGRRYAWVRDEIRRRELGKTVHLLGRHPVKSMPRFFSLADAMLVTLRNEPIFSMTIPTKIQSYLACGKPIVATVEGEGARVVQEAGAGIVAGSGDAEGLAKAVLALRRMTEAERRAMGERGRRYFEEHFERGQLIIQLERWMSELAGDCKS